MKIQNNKQRNECQTMIALEHKEGGSTMNSRLNLA